MPGAESSDMNRTHAANARPNVRPEADNAGISRFPGIHGSGKQGNTGNLGNAVNRKTITDDADKNAGGWQLADHRDRLMQDAQWMAGLASELGFDSSELAQA